MLTRIPSGIWSRLYGCASRWAAINGTRSESQESLSQSQAEYIGSRGRPRRTVIGRRLGLRHIFFCHGQTETWLLELRLAACERRIKNLQMWQDYGPASVPIKICRPWWRPQRLIEEWWSKCSRWQSTRCHDAAPGRCQKNAAESRRGWRRK